MYEERREKFSFKSFFLTLLLVVLFILLMLFLFPTRWDYKNNTNGLQSTYDIERLSVLYDEVFANNVSRMKDAAIGYYTNERMPQKVGESKKMTLQEMYDLHLVLKMKDINGDPCDTKKSYVKMTKYDKEYRLKVNLSCGEQEDYIIVYLGCYSYCSDGICEKRYEDTTTTGGKVEESKPSNSDKDEPSKDEPGKDEPSKDDPSKDEPSKDEPSKDEPSKDDPSKDEPSKDEPSKDEPSKDEPEDPKPTKKYMYEYKLVVEGSIKYTEWTKWQKNSIQSTDKVEVQTKTETELTGYETKKIQIGVKTDTIVKKVSEKYISGYSTKLVVTGTKQIQTGTTTKKVTEKVAVGTVEKYAGIKTSTKKPVSTATTKYVIISTDTPNSCSYCENETKYTYEIYNIETVYDTVTKTVTVPVYKTVNVYEQQQVPIYDYRIVEKKETVETPVYKEVKIPQYKTVVYYRCRTKIVTPGYTDIKWSYSKTDSSLTTKGYKLTGNSKEA